MLLQTTGIAMDMTSITPEYRASVFKQALEIANDRLKTHHLSVRFFEQWPPKPNIESNNPNSFDERADINLEMCVNGKWHHIDIVYMREMPIEPEKLKSPSALAKTIYDKALEHFKAMSNPSILITATGSKFDLTGLSKDDFSVDQQGYIRVSGMRVVYPRGKYMKPAKAEDFHSHHIISFRKMNNGTLLLTDPFDSIRTDHRTGKYLIRQKSIYIPFDLILNERKEAAAEYEKDYIVIVRNQQDIQRFLADPASYLKDPDSYFPH